ncbi:hypothetical protein [Nonomuraea sp. B5E05]|uniref:hypothetical protein n=1 Tax=Nonomuraea sp. B5E05 TaxID=3153569 RepID=UPI0032604F48
MEEEFTRVLGGADAVMEPLTHNPKNGVTGGIWRVRRGSRSAVLKVLTRRKDAPDGWRHSDDPRHWNYWRREADIYAGGLPKLWAGAGLRGPCVRCGRSHRSRTVRECGLVPSASGPPSVQATTSATRAPNRSGT